jgi:hypothetical protein
MKKGERFADSSARHIDNCLNILGIRVWETQCQVIANWDLPVQIPSDEITLRSAGADTMRLTAWPYQMEHPGTDIGEVLSQRKPFSTACVYIEHFADSLVIVREQFGWRSETAAQIRTGPGR